MSRVYAFMYKIKRFFFLEKRLSSFYAHFSQLKNPNEMIVNGQ